jgi:peptide-methionine (S)-S-oxide reductase
MNFIGGLYAMLFASGASKAAAGGSIRSQTRGLASMSLNNRVSLGAGCYWGTEKFIKKDFNKEVVPSSITWGKVGFMNPDANAKPDPSYRDVCSGRTGYVEVYDCKLSDSAANEADFEKLLKHFFSFHDPTTMNAQGNDRGTQYASVIFCYDKKQQEIAEKVKKEVQELVDTKTITNYQGSKVITEIVPATTFYEAQVDHQEYLEVNPFGYCNHAYRFKWSFD